MLSYAYQSLRETGLKNAATEDFDHIHDLFAAIIARGVGSQIKRGLHRDYVSHEVTLSGLRGQFRVNESIKQQTIPQGKLICAYDEFNIGGNKISVKTLDLSRDWNAITEQLEKLCVWLTEGTLVS